MNALRQCPVDGSKSGTKTGHLMCLSHWRVVPRPLQREVNDTWRAFEKATQIGLGPVQFFEQRKRYLTASAEALRVVNDQIARARETTP